MKVTPVLLIILDGFGHREECDFNAICQARKPHWNFLWPTYPHTTIDASEKWVGLPQSQMGNSEVGHMNIGAGRVVYQDYTRIENAIETGEFSENPVLAKAVATARAAGRALHVLGLLSPGGVHSHESQIHAMLDMAARGGRQEPVRARLSRRPRHAAEERRGLARRARRELPRSSARARSPRSADATTRWTATSAGSASTPAYGLITDGEAEYRAASAVEGAAGRLRARRDRRVREADGDRARRGRAGRA